MSNRVIGVKKSNFSGSTSIPGTATFDYVSNNTNLKITYCDFLNNLGATGTLVQAGNPTSTPVLDKQGSVNSIRNLSGGPGVDVSLDAFNGIQLSSSFSFDQTGAPLVDDAAAETLAFRSLVPGTGVTLTEAPGTITIEASSGGGTFPANVVVVNDITDFPAPILGVITLADNTAYQLGASVTTPDRFEAGVNSAIYAHSPLFPILTYTGTGDMFTSTGNSLTIRDLSMDCPNGTFFNLNSTVPGTGTLILTNVQTLSCQKFGVFTNLGSLNITNCSCLSCPDGVEIQGTGWIVVSISKFALVGLLATGVGIDMGSSVQNSVELTNLVLIGFAPGATGISGLAASANMAAGKIGIINLSEFAVTNPLSGITVDDIRWTFIGNDVPDTSQACLLSLSSNATPTVISAVNTPTLVLGTFVSQIASHFTGSVAGRATYNGERDLGAPIDVVASIEPVSGTNKDLAVYVAVNGSVITGSAIVQRVDSGNPGAVSAIWQLVLSENDFVEIYVENRSDAVNILVNDAVLRVR